MSDNEIMVSCRNLGKRYQEIVALEDLNIEIPRGKVFGYIGHNGAGKTTTIRILAGLLRPTSGRARVAGVDVTADPAPVKRLVGYMPDSFGVYDQMRVWEYLDFFGAAFRLGRKARQKRMEHVLEITDAGYMRDRFVDTLSHGMKQRVGIARTLMHDPQVLLLDEPANGLDPQSRVHMRRLIRRLADEGKTLLVSSHILPELAQVCDLVGIMDHGRLLACGTIDHVLARLQRDRQMELKAGAGMDVVTRVLQACPQCSGIQSDSEEPGIVRFCLSGDDDRQAELLAQLLEAGAKIVSFREVPLSLEDAYLAISSEGVVAQAGA